MNPEIALEKAEDELLIKISAYKKHAIHMQSFLSKHPGEWGRFQSEFNQEVNAIYREVMLFEKQSVADGQEDRIYRLKQIFVEKFRQDFLKGDLANRSFNKPYGYAGDHKIIDDIYLNQPFTMGLDRLFDNYFQMSAISVAVRNRKEDFKTIVKQYVSKHQSDNIRIMDIASGPCRDVRELFSDDREGCFKNTQYHCLDADQRAIDYAKQALNGDSRVYFTQMNIVRLALSKDPRKEFSEAYDVIYSTGLFDYLDERITQRLIANLRKMLKPGGVLAISDVRDKFSNPSIYFMEWVGDWNLIYRPDDEFRAFFKLAGFSENELTYSFEQQGIMQYVIARNLSAE